MTRVLEKAEVRRVYTSTAPFYDVWARLTESRARRRVLDLAAVCDGETVLEVAVGTGLLFAELLRYNPHGRNQGIDLTPAMLERARTRAARSGATNWRLSEGDAGALDFPAGSFDVVLNCYMFDLLPEADFERVLSEFHRVLRPGGRVIIASLAPAESVTYKLWQRLYRINPGWVGGCRGVELAGPIERARFQIDLCERIVQLALVTELIRAVKLAN
ncbi:MAG: methyltransferase domain-containing protein [Deltaproteobacteria bacterium]|nr:methyltransferase domain-containing protein [Deltaproteobacteria bacterium]MBI3388534.1 methyltransferase domain-containing protein [Deltaproteobacteria bacterium]